MSHFATILVLACALSVVAALNYSPEDYPKKDDVKESNATNPHPPHKPHKGHNNPNAMPPNFQHAKPCDGQPDQHHHFNQAPHHMHHGPPAIHYHYHYETACGCQQQQQTCKPQEEKPEPVTAAPIVEEPLTTEEVKVTERVARFTPVAPIELHQKAAAFFKDPERAEYNNRKFDRDH